jgi:hypothetical protein
MTRGHWNTGWRPVVLTITLLIGLSQAPAAQVSQEPEELDRYAGDGQQCLVCGLPIHDQDVVEIRYKGRTFHVSADMLGEFRDRPDTYFRRLQARSVLFDERSTEAGQLSVGWLIVGCYVLVGLVFAALCGYLAVARSLEPVPWFFAGLIGNLAALFVLLATPRGNASTPTAGLTKVPTTREPLPCPDCGSHNHPAATNCSECGSTLSPAVEAETVRV